VREALDVLELVLLVAAVLLALPVLVLVVQIISALGARAFERAEPSPLAPAERSAALAVLMPAHDEATGIGESIAALWPQLNAQDRLLVVADNCSDDTAAVARALGAEVVERSDAEHRGKGFALDFGMKHLAQRPPAIVLVVDADCIVAAGAVDLLARRCLDAGRPVQALYLMRAPEAAALKTRVAEFAWLVKNQVRALGSHRLGLPCQLMGSGMAFPWEVLRDAPLASGHIVEDLQLGLDLAAVGAAPVFCPRALVTSTFPLATAGLATQRTRWEHGHLGVIASMGPRLLWQAVRRRQGALAAMVLDVGVPPMAALLLALSIVVVMSAALAALGAAATALLVASVTIVVLVLALVAAWNEFGRGIVTFAELATAPAYAIGKIPMYVRMARKRQTEWVRTQRDDAKR